MALGLAEQRQHQAVAVDDAGRGRQQRVMAGKCRLQRGELDGVDPAQIVHAVGARALGDRLQRRRLRRSAGDHQLAAARVAYPVLRAPGVQALAALHAQAGLERAGRVVQPGVDHLAVARADAGAEGGLALDHHHLASGAGEAVGAGEADHASADHYGIDRFHRRGPVRCGATRAPAGMRGTGCIRSPQGVGRGRERGRHPGCGTRSRCRAGFRTGAGDAFRNVASRPSKGLRLKTGTPRRIRENAEHHGGAQVARQLLKCDDPLMGK
jgi:hypothetical protein